jgi:hypothetical protein
MKSLRVCMLIIWILFGAGFAGCGGGGAKTDVQTNTTTLGKELQDLQNAYDKGIITKEQYEQSKEKLIKQRTK